MCCPTNSICDALLLGAVSVMRSASSTAPAAMQKPVAIGITAALMLLASPASAGLIQLGSPADLPGSAAMISFENLTQDFVPNPYVANAGGQTVSFSLHTGQWRRLDEGNNVFSDFVPGTSLLYTNNNSGCGLHGCSGGTIGGGGSGPVDILFSGGAGAFGLQAQTQVLGDETFTISVYDALTLLGAFDVSGISAQRQDGSALFLGAAATDGDLITRVHITSTVVQGGYSVNDDFFIGPVTFAPVPEPPSSALLGGGLLLLGLSRLALLVRRKKPCERLADAT